MFIWRFYKALVLAIIKTVNHGAFSEFSEYFNHFGILGVGAVSSDCGVSCVVSCDVLSCLCHVWGLWSHLCKSDACVNISV